MRIRKLVAVLLMIVMAVQLIPADCMRVFQKDGIYGAGLETGQDRERKKTAVAVPSEAGTGAPANTPEAFTKAGEAASDAPESTPAVTPADIPAGIPANTPAGTPVNTPTSTTTNTTAGTPTNIPTYIPSATPTNTPTDIPADTPTNTPTDIPSATPTNTPTDIPADTPTNTPTDIPSATPTNTPTDIPTNTPTSISTATPTNTPTDIPVATPTNTPTSISTATPTNTPTDIPADTPTNTPEATPTSTPLGGGRITLNLDRTAARVGEIITAVLEVSDIHNIGGYQVNLRYNPLVLQPVDPSSLSPFGSNTNPVPGSLMAGRNCEAFFVASNDALQGTLNFGAYFVDRKAYKSGGTPESAGSLAVIAFRVLKPNVTDITLEECATMPGSIGGTYIYDWDGMRLTGYSVSGAETINAGGPAALPTPAPVETAGREPGRGAARTSLMEGGALYKIMGYVNPDLSSPDINIKAGFLVEVEGTQLSALTDASGFFRIDDVPESLEGYTVKISKTSYLYREIQDVAVNSYVLLGSAEEPVDIWAGDVLINGVQDNIISMNDMSKISQYFNTIKGDGIYDPNYDLNCDNTITMDDLMIAAAHFNTSPASYPAVTPVSVQAPSTVSSNMTLEGDLYYGDLTITGGIIDLNGHRMYVYGNLTQTGGTMNIDGGQLFVAGNYEIATQDGDRRSSGHLVMTTPSDYVLVRGDFMTASTDDHRNYLTAGTMEIKGSFTQRDIYPFAYSGYNFAASGTHKVILSGTRHQTVSFLVPTSSQFNILEITNSSAEGVYFATRANVYKELKATDSIVVNSKNLRLRDTAIISGGSWKWDLSIYQNWTLQQDQVIEGDFYTNSDTVTDLNGWSLTINSNCNQQDGSEIDLNRGTMTVGGNMNQTGGTMNVNNGTLTVNQNYTMNGSEINLNRGAMAVGGNMNETGGTMNVNNGTLTVNQNYIITGDSALLMRNEAEYVLVNGNFSMGSKISHEKFYDSNEGLLTAGTLEIRGNFEQTSIDNIGGHSGQYIYSPSKNFAAGGTHKVLLSGTGRQTMSFEDHGSSQFNILEITNSSAEGVSFTTKANVIRELKATDSIVVNGRNLGLRDTAIISGGNWKWDLGVLWDWTVQQDQVIEGNFYVNENAVIDLNGLDITINGDCNMLDTSSINLNRGAMTVGGNMNQTGGTMNVNNGTLTVNQNYIITGNSALLMRNETEHVLVNGNFSMRSKISHEKFYDSNEGLLTAGTLEIRGNFEQTSIDNIGGSNGQYIYSPSKNFAAGGTHKILLSGAAQQTVSFEDHGSSQFNILEITNSSAEGVSVTTKANVIRELKATDSIVVNGRNLGLRDTAIISGGSWKWDLGVFWNWTVQQDQVIEGNFYVNENAVIDLNGLDITINGDCNMLDTSSINLNRGAMTVGGNMNQTGGTMNVNNGTLTVNQNYIITGDSALLMRNEAEYVLVNGNFSMGSRISHEKFYNSNEGLLTAGTLEIRGNFEQTSIGSIGGSNGQYIYSPSKNFAAGGTHKILLSGAVQQTVSFEDLGSSQFNILEITNSSAAGVNILNTTPVKTELKSTSTPVTNSRNLCLRDTAIISGGSWKWDLGVYLGWTIQQDQVIEGSLYPNGNTISLNGYALTVFGSLAQTGGTVDVKGGNLTVNGNYNQTEGALYVDGGQVNIGTDYSMSGSTSLRMTGSTDKVTVSGNYTMSSTVGHASYLTAGILEVKGNFTQKAGAAENFKATGTHKVILSGAAVQTVNFQNYTSSNFNLLEINNPIAGVNFTSTITLNKLTNISNVNYAIPVIVVSPLSEDINVGGSLAVRGGVLDLNGKTLNISYNMIIDGGTVDLKGGEISVGNNLIQPAGTMNINGGELTVTGDYCIQTQDGAYSSGYLKMQNPSDYVLIGEDFLTDSRYDHSTYLIAGVLEVKGNFTQKSGYSSGNTNFKTNGTFKILLSGSGQQDVNFEDPLTSYFNILQITNTSNFGVCFMTDACVTGELVPYQGAAIYHGNRLKMKGSARISGEWDGVLGVADNWTLPQVVIIKGDLYVGSNSVLNLNRNILSVNRLLQSGGSANVASGKLDVKDSIYLSGGTLDINYGEVDVKNKLVHSGGTMFVDNGKLIINGDYFIQTETQDNEGHYIYSIGAGILRMTNNNDYINVSGKFAVQSTANSRSNLTAGVLEVGGDFSQLSSGQTYAFAPSGSHKVLLSGESRQTVKFDDSNYSMFNYVILPKPVNSGYTFIPEMVSKYPAQKTYAEFNKNGKTGVNPANGNYSRTFTDMTLPAPGFEIKVARTYNSSLNRDYGYILRNQIFGKGWTFSYESYIKNYENRIKDPVTGNVRTFYDINSKMVLMPDGNVVTFKFENGSYTANDSRNTLVQNPDGTYTLTTKDKEKYLYDLNGWLRQISDRSGNTIYINVSGDGKIQNITDAAGRQFTFHYENNLLKSITDGSANRTVYYQYDVNGRLYKVQDPMGYYTTHTYDSNGNLATVSDNGEELLESVTYIQDGAKKGWVSTITDENHCVKSFNYQEMMTEITEGARKTIQYFDGAYYPTTIVDPDNKSTQIIYKPYGGENIGEVMSITDRNGNKTLKDIDGRGNVTRIVNPDNSVKVFAFDDNDNMTGETDEDGNCTVYVYDQESKLIKKAQYLKKITPGSLVTLSDNNYQDFAVTEYKYYSQGEAPSYKAKGLLKEIKDPVGFITGYTYTSDGNVATVKDPENNTTAYTYNSLRLEASVRTPEGYITYYTYDSEGRLEMTWDNTTGKKTRILYDCRGRRLKEVSPKFYDPNLDYMDSHNYDPDNTDTRYYRYQYDDGSRTKTVTDPEGNTTVYTYDIYGNLETETKPNLAKYFYYYDGIDRLTKIAVQDVPDGQLSVLEEYSYDILLDRVLPGNITLMKTQKTLTRHLNASDTAATEYYYDYAGRLIEQQNPDNTSIKTTYYGNGKVKTTIDGKGNTTFYKYDYKFDRFYNYDPQNVIYEAKRIPIEKDTNGTIRYAYSETIYDMSGLKREERVGREKVLLEDYPVNYITTKYDYYMNGKVKTTVDSNGKITGYEYDGDGNVTKETAVVDADSLRVTEYNNNYLGKPDEKKIYVAREDLYGSYPGSSTEIALITEYTYDLNGNLETVTTPEQVTTTYEYDNLDRQTSVSQPGQDEFKSPVNIKTSVRYGWDGQPLEAVDARGNKTEYGYTQRGQLKTVTRTVNGEEETTAYFYDNAGRKTAEVSPGNYDLSKTIEQMNRKVYTYDGMDRLKTEGYKGEEKKIDPITHEWVSNLIDIVTKAYTYDNNGNIAIEQDATGYENGYGTEYIYNPANKVAQVLDPESKARSLTYTEKYDYDTSGRKISEEKAKGDGSGKYYSKTWYEYDDAGNIKTIKVKRNSAQNENVSPTRTVQANTYDYAGNLLSRMDGNGNTVTYKYNAFDKVSEETRSGDATIQSYTSYYLYDETGRLKKQLDSMGKTDLYTYDSQGRQLSHTEQKTDGTGAITVTAAYDVDGNKRFETDGNGKTKEYIYDNLNRVKTERMTVANTGGTTAVHTTDYTYDHDGNLITQTEKVETGGLTSSGAIINTYDAKGRLIEKKDQNGKTAEKLEYNHNGAQIKSYDALNNLTQFEYDKNGRLTKTIDPEEHTVSQSYDNAGNIRTKTDGRENTTTYSYDEFDRLASVRNAKNETTSYTYDLNGNMLTQTDARGNITTYTYNAADKASSKTDDALHAEVYSYYADGSLMAETDRNGDVTSYGYDIHGRLLSQTTTKAGYTAVTISYTYDNNGNQLTMTDSTGTTTRIYDELNRVKTKTVPNIGTTAFTYDIITADGLTAEKAIDPKNNKTTKIYDRVGRLYKVIDGDVNGTPGATYGYFDNGNRQYVEYGDGAREEYTYYPDSQLHTLTNKKAGGTILETYTYEYDTANNQSRKNDGRGITDYTYDALNRMVTVTEPNGRTTSYTFDAAGNRSTETVVYGGTTTVNTYAYDDLNRLTGITARVNGSVAGTTSYIYDANGNQLTETVNGQSSAANTYDLLDRLVTTSASGNTVINTYNGEGLRVSKQVNGVITRYLYEYDQVVLETDGSNNQKARDIYGTNLLSRTVGGQTLYYMYNGHADVTALIDAVSKQVVGTYYYDAFGNILEQTGSVNNNITYAGYWYDGETGLYYLNARMYDPVTARFLQEDDPGYSDPNDPLSLNLYTYCHNEPIMYTDPSGYKYVRKYVAPGYTDLVWEEDHWWEKVGNAVSSIADWTNNNVVKPAASWGGQQIENFKTGVDALSSWDKFYEAMDLINTYGSDSEKIVGNITGWIGRTGIIAKDSTVGVTKTMFVDAPLETSAIILTGAVAINGNKSLTDETWRRTHDTIKAIDNFIEKNFVTDKQSYETGQFTGMAGNLALGLGGLIEGAASLPRAIKGVKAPETVTNIFGGTAREASTGMKMSNIPDDFGKMNIRPITPNAGVSKVNKANPNGVFENAPYHGKTGNSIKSKAPIDGQAALDNSVQVSKNSPRRVGVSEGEIVVIDETHPGKQIYHGHVRQWSDLTDDMRKVLKDAGLVNNKGKVIK